MCSITFNNLSTEAKGKAFATWAALSNGVFAWEDVVEEVLDDIEDVLSVCVVDYNFTTGAFTLPEISYDNYVPKGVRAGKLALEAYYLLTESYQKFCKMGYHKPTAFCISKNCRYSSFIKVNECFTAHHSSETFSKALFESIREHYTNETYTYHKHLMNAFDALFKEALEYYKYQDSYEAFTDSQADEVSYHSDGSIYEEVVI